MGTIVNWTVIEFWYCVFSPYFHSAFCLKYLKSSSPALCFISNSIYARYGNSRELCLTFRFFYFINIDWDLECAINCTYSLFINQQSMSYIVFPNHYTRSYAAPQTAWRFDLHGRTNALRVVLQTVDITESRWHTHSSLKLKKTSADSRNYNSANSEGRKWYFIHTY